MAFESVRSESMCEVCRVNTISYCSPEKAVMLAKNIAELQSIFFLIKYITLY